MRNADLGYGLEVTGFVTDEPAVAASPVVHAQR